MTAAFTLAAEREFWASCWLRESRLLFRREVGWQSKCRSRSFAMSIGWSIQTALFERSSCLIFAGAAKTFRWPAACFRSIIREIHSNFRLPGNQAQTVQVRMRLFLSSNGIGRPKRGFIVASPRSKKMRWAGSSMRRAKLLDFANHRIRLVLCSRCWSRLGRLSFHLPINFTNPMRT